MAALRWLLWPFAVLYDAATRFRNHLYDIGMRPSAAFDLPTICIGNLAVGGTGKTPHAEYLLRLLLPQYRVAVLSRGYGRKTRGPLLAGPDATPAQIGDEPMQLYRQFGHRAVIAVAEERILGIPHLLADHPDTEVVLLDDAFQHRKLRPGLALVLTDFARPFSQDWLLPMGRLREARKGAARAQAIVVTKCPSDLSGEAQEALRAELGRYAPGVPVFFTAIAYGAPRPLGASAPCQGPWVAVSGIVRPAPFVAHLQSIGGLNRHFDFPDHHAYTEEDILRAVEAARACGGGIMLTDKDAVKWEIAEYANLWREVPVYSLPMEVAFLGGSAAFDAFIAEEIAKMRI